MAGVPDAVLRLLVVDEDPDDAARLAAAVERGGREVSWRRVATRPGLLDALVDGGWDAVLVDRALGEPGWREVVELGSGPGTDVPVIVVANEGREELAAEALRAGAAEYVVREQLWRLGPALERELGRAAARRTVSREHAEYELLGRELNVLLQQSPFFVWATDSQLRITRFWGPAAATDYVGRMVGDVDFGDVRELVNAHRAALDGGGQTDFEISGNGRVFRCAVDAVTVAGETTGCVGVGVEISQLRSVERDLQDSEARFRTIVESTLDILMIIDAGAKIVFANPAAERALGYPLREFVGTDALAYVHPDDVADARRALSVSAAGKDRGRFEFRVRDSEGTWHIVESVVARLETEGIDGVVVAARDLTERRRLEAQLRRRESLELIGQLAGGVAHDFNNVLQVIRGYASMLLGRDDAGDESARDSLGHILGAADRAAELVGQLLAIGRRQVLDPRPVNLAEAVAGFEPLLRQALPAAVELRLELAESPVVLCDPSQVERAILNLVINAREAIGDAAGTVLVRAEEVELGADDAAALQPEVQPGRYGALCVADTGCGIPAEIVPRLFEAFFTTKGEAGNGLGLATVYGIVSQGGGGISVVSAPGDGATFTIYLPLARSPLPATPGDGGAGGEGSRPIRVLLVEDEAQTRPLLQRMLESFGCQASAAADAEEALRLAAGREFDLLVTDIVMPGMDGYQLAERFELEHPGTATLFITGLPLVAGAPPCAGARTLQKPFGAEDFERRIHEALAVGPASRA